jgi:hypothetical protein
LDITQQNFVTAERNKCIPNADVNQIAFSKKGTWLATVESRRDQQTTFSKTKCTELRLKFWKFNKTKQM